MADLCEVGGLGCECLVNTSVQHTGASLVSELRQEG